MNLSPSVSPYSGSKALASAFWSQGASTPNRRHLLGAHRGPGAGWVGVQVKMTPRQTLLRCYRCLSGSSPALRFGTLFFFFFGPGFGHSLQ